MSVCGYNEKNGEERTDQRGVTGVAEIYGGGKRERDGVRGREKEDWRDGKKTMEGDEMMDITARDRERERNREKKERNKQLYRMNKKVLEAGFVKMSYE